MYPQPLNEASAAHVAACVVAAFDQLHPRSILFRGLDASTIAVDRNGLAQLVDFRYFSVAMRHLICAAVMTATGYVTQLQVHDTILSTSCGP